MDFESVTKGHSRRKTATAVVKHYLNHKRDLPWRNNNDPYRIWVSEIMLQQTQVATVIPYFNRWMTRFPTIQHLAEATLEEVLTLWTGLGYYRRCRFLHEGAKQIVGECHGTLPKTTKELQKIKGIGPYTAGAISSIAFGLPAPIVDGNVERLLSRIFAMKHNIKSKEGQAYLWKLSEWLVPTSKSSEFNQGMMELGATICKPKNPTCNECPLSNNCRAFKEGTVSSYPVKSKKLGRGEKKRIAYNVAWLTRRNKILLCRRHLSGLFPGVWELPHAKSKKSLSHLFTNPMVIKSKAITAFDHVLSHRLLDIKLYPAEIEGKVKLKNVSVFDKTKWFSRSELSTIGLSSAMKRLIDHQLGVNA